MICIFFMAMVILNNLIEKVSKSMIWIVTSCIDSNTRISIFATREYCLSKIETEFILNIMEFFPNISAEIFW